MATYIASYQNKFVDLLYFPRKEYRGICFKVFIAKKELYIQPLRASKFSSKAHFNFMHLAFVNGSNKRDFYVMRKEAKKTCAYLLEPFS